MYGLLIPLGGGDTIPLTKKKLLVGRRESCDIVLRFPNVSAHHCELFVQNGYWYVQDLNSRNGVKVNNVRLEAGEKRLDPGAKVGIARHKFEIKYTPSELGAVGPPPDNEAAEIFGKSLLERAGLSRGGRGGNEEPDDTTRIDSDSQVSGRARKKTRYDQ